MSSERDRFRLTGRRLAVWAALLLPIAVPAEVLPGPYQRPGVNERVSTGLPGGPGDGPSYTPAAGIDGRHVVFYSQALNLVEDTISGAGDIYRRDRGSAQTELVSAARDGGSGNSSAFQPAVSADGQVVAFLSYATDLVEGDGGTPMWAQVFVRDFRTGKTRRITAGPEGEPANGGSLHTAISRDGRYVAFLSHAGNLVPDDSNGVGDVFVHDLQTGETKRVSVAPDGAESDAISSNPAFSADGRWLAFYSRATNLVPGVNDNPLLAPVTHAYVRDLETGALEVVSVRDDGTPGNMDSGGGLAISADGSIVAFQSVASNLVPHDINGEAIPFDGVDIFVRDRASGSTERVSVASSGANPPTKSASVSISDCGRYVAFQSLKEGEDPGSFVAASDAYVHDRLTRGTELLTVDASGQAGDGDTKNPRLSPGGDMVLFQTDAANLVDGQAKYTEIVLRHRGPSPGLYRVDAPHDGGIHDIGGLAGFGGKVLSWAERTPVDSTDLAWAAVVYRHESADLLVRWRMPGLGRIETPTATRPLGPSYALAFVLNGSEYRIRAEAMAIEGAPTGVPAFGLYQCELLCELVTALEGGYGTAGEEVRVALPLGAVNLPPGSVLGELRAYRSVLPLPGDPGGIEALPLDDAVIPAARVEFGITLAESGIDEVDFVEAELTEGSFLAAPDTLPQAPGAYWLWLRACLADDCGYKTVPFSIQPQDNAIFDDRFEQDP